jgi:hypothetical protein
LNPHPRHNRNFGKGGFQVSWFAKVSRFILGGCFVPETFDFLSILMLKISTVTDDNMKVFSSDDLNKRSKAILKLKMKKYFEFFSIKVC